MSFGRNITVVLLVAIATYLATPVLCRAIAACTQTALSRSLPDPYLSRFVSSEAQMFRAESQKLGATLRVRGYGLQMVFGLPLVLVLALRDLDTRRRMTHVFVVFVLSFILSCLFLGIYVESQFVATAEAVGHPIVPAWRAATVNSLSELLGDHWTFAYLVASGVWLTRPRGSLLSTAAGVSGPEHQGHEAPAGLRARADSAL